MAEINIDDLYSSVTYAETGGGGYPDPWMRTEAIGTGSSAYGPAMLTGGKSSKMRDALIDPYQNKKINPTAAESNYLERFLKQADEMLADVDEEAREGTTYGYSGPGVLRSDEDKALYKSIAKKIIKFELEYRHDDDIEKFIKAWRGPTEKFIPGGIDPGNKSYFDKFWREYKRLTDIRNKKNDRASILPDETVMSEFIKENGE